MPSSSTEWEAYARREPYFAVLTDERFLRERMTDETREELYRTGEADIEKLFDDIASWRGAPFAPRSALDFGCGVGRLTRALARRVPDVIGCDAAPSMLRLAAEAVPAATFATELPDRRFDFICSLIVFQHIPVAEGESLVARLARMLEEGGVAALHFTFHRPGGALRRLARRVRARVPLVHRVVARIEGDRRGLPYMQMNEYERERIVTILRDAGCREPLLLATNHGGMEGAIVITERPRRVSSAATARAEGATERPS